MKTYLSIVAAILLLAACTSGDRKAASGAMIACVSDSTKQASCVYLTVDEKDQPVISWCETDPASSVKHFYMSFYNEQSGRFSGRINIPIEQNASLHEEGMPKLAVKGDGTIIAVYETAVGSEKNKFAGFVRYVVSADKGKTWSQPGFLHADTSSDNSHSFAAVIRLGDGEVGACWLDQSFGGKVQGRPVKFAKTTAGNRFGNELIIDSVACQCCRIAMSGNEDGKIAVAFRDILNDSIRDISVSHSGDNGKTFTPAIPFSNDGWVINGCPHNGPSLALAEKNIHAVWFTGGNPRGMYYCEMNDQNQVLKKQLVSDQGRFIQLTLLPGNLPVLAYNETVKEGDNIYSKIVLNKIENDRIFSMDITAERSKANYPVLQHFGRDKMVVAWWDNGRIYYAVASSGSINKPLQRMAVAGVASEHNFSQIKLAVSKDPVCGMSLSMSPGDTASFKGQTYGFCSETCKQRFQLHPESFAGE